MLVIGSIEWGSTIDKGDFVCPNCESLKSYQRKIIRPFLTLYFIPVLPLGGLKEIVICRGCRGRFSPDILTETRAAKVSDPVALLNTSSFDMELLRLIALMIVEDDHVTETELQMGQRVYQGMLRRELTRLNWNVHAAKLSPCASMPPVTWQSQPVE